MTILTIGVVLSLTMVQFAVASESQLKDNGDGESILSDNSGCEPWALSNRSGWAAQCLQKSYYSYDW